MPNQGTSVNNYNNKWGVAYVKYPNFCTPTITEQFYSVLSGTNLNSNSGFETWFTLTNGSPTTAWLQVSYNCGKHGCTVKTYSAALPSGNPNVAIDGWEGVTVCDFNGCNTNFSPGSQGQFAYYQKNMVVSSPNTSWYTSETSNCIYGSVSQPLSYEGYQSDTC